MVGLPLVPHLCGPDASESPCIENCLARLKQTIPNAAIVGYVTEKEDSYIILE